MRFIAVDWGTSRCRAVLVENGEALQQASSDEGVSRLKPGEHESVFARLCGAWLAAEPDLPVLIAGMAGSREGWVEAPYVASPAGADEIAAGLTHIPLATGGTVRIVPGLRLDGPNGVDVMRGEETHLLGTGITDGVICLPGTHCKWAQLREGRIVEFATFMTGEMHALLREHSMIGRPATDPPDQAGFGLGLDAAWSLDGRRGGLLNLLFGARAATVSGTMARDRLGPYLSGLLTGAEIAGALRLFGKPEAVTIVADSPRADLYVESLARLGIETRIIPPGSTLIQGLARILAVNSGL